MEAINYQTKKIAAMNQNDSGTVNLGDPNFIKFLIETYG